MLRGVSTSLPVPARDERGRAHRAGRAGDKEYGNFSDDLSEYKEEFARLLLSRRGNLFVNSVHVLNTQFEPQLFAQHPRAKADAFAILHEAMRAAHIFGAERYTFHALTRLKKNSAPADCGRLAANFCEIAAACAEHGVKLCSETVHWALYNAPGIFSAIRRGCPQLLGVLDVKQARLSCYPYQMYIKDMEGAISHVHLSTWTMRGTSASPGRGTFDFETCLRRLKDAGFDGALLIEVYPHDFGAYEELKQACGYLDELVYKIGG